MSNWARILFWPARFLAIYFAFFLIAFGAATLGFVLIPIWQLLFSRKLVAEDYRIIISKGVCLYLWLLELGNLLEVSYENLENISKDKAVIFVANHPSLLDVLFFFARFPTCCCVVKEDLTKFSPYAPLIRGAGYLKNSSVDILEEAKAELSRGNPIVIFPEGTRSEFRKCETQKQFVYKFQRGAANIALRCGCNIHPVEIALSPPVLAKNQAWYHLPHEKCGARLMFQSAMPVDLAEGESAQSAARRVTANLESLFSSFSSCSR